MKKLLISSTLLIVVCIISFGAEPCLTEAWESYKSRNWEMAIQNANDCVFSFKSDAKELQTHLAEAEYALPQNHTVIGVLSDQEKDEIFAHGLLNDVCTSYWIIGMSHLRLGNKDKSDDAFRKAVELTFGLCYDERDFFWSPSLEAKKQLRN